MIEIYLQVSSADEFSNNLDPGKTRQIVGPDLDPNCLALGGCFVKVDFVIYQHT